MTTVTMFTSLQVTDSNVGNGRFRALGVKLSGLRAAAEGDAG